MEYTKQNAEVTFEQMGGKRALALMVGASFFYNEKSQMAGFTFKGSRKFNRVQMILTAEDLYVMTFYRIGKFEIKAEKTIDGLYFDQLANTFESETGLTLRVPRIFTQKKGAANV